jgi:hypothetical protein
MWPPSMSLHKGLTTKGTKGTKHLVFVDFVSFVVQITVLLGCGRAPYSGRHDQAS